MVQRIAVETLTLSEISDLFQQAIEIALPKFTVFLPYQVKKIKKAKITNYKWVKTYEDFKGAKLNFYCQILSGVPDTIVSIGMTHRTTKGLILVSVDTSNGGIAAKAIHSNTKWRKWVRIHTGHYCERYAERIMKVEKPTFEIGAEGIMFSDELGPVRSTDKVSEEVDEIEFQFKEGQAYGYRDSKNKIIWLRTVYSNEMLKGDRLQFKEDSKESIDQLCEMFKWSS